MMTPGAGERSRLLAKPKSYGYVVYYAIVASAVVAFLYESKNQMPSSLKQSVAASENLSKFPSALLDRPLPCPRVSEEVQFSRVFPNEKLLARKTITTPRFWISSHDEQFDRYRWNIINTGEYYEHILTKIAGDALRDVAPGFVIDVGANIGWLSLVAASFGHSVISVEPNPANQMRLCQSILLNDWAGRIDVFPNGISDKPGSMTLKWNGNPGEAKLQVGSAEKRDRSAVEVAVVTLDQIAESKDLFAKQIPVYFLKVDVESFEPQVFRGATKLLRSGLVRTILHEMSVTSDPTVHAGLRSMIRNLLEMGYVPRGLAHTSLAKQLERTPTVESLLSNPSDETLEKIISECGRNNGQCDLVWDHKNVVHAVMQRAS